jgi:hypothetical protein
MALLSAREDFTQRTLGALANLWEKLAFTARLKSDDGGYRHWGLEREHGSAASREAIAHAHRVLILEIAEMPMHDAVREAEGYGDLRRLESRALCPPGMEDCLQKHVDYVLWTTQAISAAHASARLSA